MGSIPHYEAERCGYIAHFPQLKIGFLHSRNEEKKKKKKTFFFRAKSKQETQLELGSTSQFDV